jgi:hypothetical protein
MNQYILFVYGQFEDHEDVEYFCNEIFSQSETIESVKYIIENLQNIILIFESSTDQTKLSIEIFNLLDNENINYYFLFQKSGMVSAHIPSSINEHIFKFKVDELPNTNEEAKMDLDLILDKIKKEGIGSLTKDEKNFLDNFEN